MYNESLVRDEAIYALRAGDKIMVWINGVESDVVLLSVMGLYVTFELNGEIQKHNLRITDFATFTEL